MKAYVLEKNGSAGTAFVLRERADLHAGPGQVLVDVEAFGLNYADVSARLGSYRDAPPMPCVIGYEVVGRVKGVGTGVTRVRVGQRVSALTRFGGYATEAVTQEAAVIPIPEDMPAGVAAAFAVQYATAWYCAMDRVQLHPGEHVLVQAAAGGVGTALVQLAKACGCIVYGTAGGAEKMAYLRELGVDHPIDYRKDDFYEVIRSLPVCREGRGLDVVFDSLGGRDFKRGYKLLGVGGRIVGFGAASRVGGKSIFRDIRMLLGFGFYNPAFLLMNTRSVIGVNMLRLADYRPEALQRCLEGVLDWVNQGKLQPHVGGDFPHTQLAEAHALLESRKSMGKIIVRW